MSKYFLPVSNIQGGDSIFWSAQLAPLLIWGVLVYRYYYIPEHHHENPITNVMLFVPVLGVLYNIYLAYNHKGPSPPRSWNFCARNSARPRVKFPSNIVTTTKSYSKKYSKHFEEVKVVILQF